MQYKNNWLPVSALCLALAACGGGSPDASNNGADTSLATTSGKVEYDTYATPAGALCSQTSDDALVGEYCVEPTSSSTTPEKLIAYLLNSNGKLVHFSLTGFGQFVDKTGLSTYEGMSTKDVFLGQHIVKMEGRTYGPDEAPFSPPGMETEVQSHLLKAGDDLGKQLVLQTGNALDLVDLRRQNLTDEVQSDGLTHLMTWDFWTTMLGLRTDWSDAPNETKLTFTGGISIQGDMGGTYVTIPDQGSVRRDSSINCTVEATLQVKEGWLTLKVSECTSADVPAGVGPTTGSISSPDGNVLFVKKSVVSAGLKPIQVHVANADLQLSVDETITDLTGGIYGSNARTLFIEGHGPHSSIRLSAMRPELLSGN